jgi:hypothetical protein
VPAGHPSLGGSSKGQIQVTAPQGHDQSQCESPDASASRIAEGSGGAPSIPFAFASNGLPFLQ